jgi:hypothetical protein
MTAYVWIYTMNNSNKEMKSDPRKMFSYINGNTAFHAKLTEYCLKTNPRTLSCRIYVYYSINVACLGGSPGSEAFGLQMFLKKSQAQQEQHYTLYDLTLWQRCWQSTRNTTKGYLISPSFNVLDVTDQNERNWTIADDTILLFYNISLLKYIDIKTSCKPV